MKIKVFTDSRLTVLEEQVNKFLEKRGSIVKILQTQSSTEGDYPIITISIFYNDIVGEIEND